MSGTPYDIVAIGDFRFPGGTSTAVAQELRLQASAGYRTGLIQLKGPVLKFPHAINPKIRACIDEGLADLLDPDAPVAARLVLAHHPSVFAHLPRRALRIDAEARNEFFCTSREDLGGQDLLEPQSSRTVAQGRDLR